MNKILPGLSFLTKIKFYLIVGLLVFGYGVSWGQTTYTWVGPNNGSWAIAANWNPTRTTTANNDILQFNSGTTLNIISVPSQTIGRLLITNNSQITLNTAQNNHNLNISNLVGEDLQIDSGAKLTLVSSSNRFRITLAANATGLINGELVLGNLGNLRTNNTGVSITVNGKITNTGGSFSNSATNKIIFNEESEYHHARNGTAFPLATWAPTSILRVTGTQNTTSGNTDQNFGDVILASPEYNVNMSFSPLSIAGNLTIQNPNNNQQIRIASSFTIGGNLNLISGHLAFQNNNTSRIVTVNGNVTISGGTMDLSRTSGSGTLLLNGNYSQSGGLVTETSSSFGLINFQGGGPIQFFSKTGGTFSQTINFEVTASSFLQFADATSSTSGSIGTFVMGTGATLGIRSPDGISVTGATGHIQNTGIRTFSTTGNYIYNGSVNQAIGTGPPATINSFIIANTGASGSNTVTFNANRTITSDLSVLSGTFNLSTFTANRVAAGGTLTLAANTNLLVGGTNNFPMDYTTWDIDCASTVNYNAASNQTIGAVNYGNLILSGSGVKTFQTGTTDICNNFTLTGTASSTAVIGLTIGGNVNIGTGTIFSGASFTHNVGGNWTRAGTFTPGTSTINFNGDNPASIQSTTFNNLTFSGTGAKTASGNLTANGTILISNNFNAGAFSHSLSGNWTNNGTFTTGNSLISFTGSAAQSISGTSPTAFQALTINNPLSVGVNSPISVSTNLTLSNGDFNTNGNLTMLDESQILLTNALADLNGTIQGTEDYDVIYSGGNRPTGEELSGAGLRNVTLTSTAGSTLTSTSNFTMKGQLNIPNGITFNMGSFSIGPTLITTLGGGQLQTQSTSLEPLPQDVTWSFVVKYNKADGGQTIVYGIYENLEILSTSGTNTMEPEGSGDFVIRNQLIVTNPATVDATDSRVEFNGLAAQTIAGLTFKKLVLSGSGNKTFDAGTSISNELVINPTAIARLGNIDRSVEVLILNGIAQGVGSYGSTASTATNKLATYFGTIDPGILFVTNVCQDGKWTGDVSSDWFDPANWCNGLPTATTDVTIPATVNQPEINTTGALSRNITIESGASLSMTGTSTFSVRGNWINNGTFSAGTGTVTFQSTAVQTSSGSSANNFANLTISNPAGVSLGTATIVSGTLTLASGALGAGTSLTMSVNSAILRTAGSLTGTLQGSNAYDVSYSGNSKTSGPELVNTGLRNLTVNLTAGQTLTLGGTPALPDGNLSLTSGRLNAGAISIDRSTAGGTLTIGAGTTFITSANGTAAFPTNYTTRTIDASSTVEYAGTNQTVATNTYGNVILGGASGVKTFAGATSFAGNLSIAATTSANLGTANSSANTLTLGSVGQPNGSYGSTASSAIFKVATSFGISATGILNVTNSTLACVNGFWIGGTSTDWFTTSNWCNGIVPTATTDVLIPANAPFKPVINANGAIARNLNIESGASLGISETQTLTLNGNFINNGTFVPATGTVVFGGTATQTISGSSTSSFFNLISTNSTSLGLSAPISIGGTLSLTAGNITAGSNLTMNVNSAIIRGTGAMTGTIQGANIYSVSYQGTSKTTGSELSGGGLNSVTVSLNANQILTAGNNFTVRGNLNIPTNVTLNMATFQLSGNLTTTGSGTLSTQSISASPLTSGRSWSFSVSYNNLNGGQKVVSGIYQNLSVQNNSGTTTLAPGTEGLIEIASGDFSKSGSGTLAAGTSSVVFSGPGSQSIPAVTFFNLELRGGGDKTFTGSQNILGNLTIRGTAIARLWTTNRTANSLTLGGIDQPAGSFGSTASSATFKRPQFFGTTDTGLLNVTINTAICDEGTWQGTVSTNWFTPGNWCGNKVPTLTTDVFIPSTTPFQPLISANGAIVQNLVIETGATVQISGAFTLTVGGNWENNGTFIPGTTSTVTFAGVEDGSISGGNFANISFTGAGTKSASGNLTISGNLLISNNFDAGDQLHSLAGNWTNNGDFSSGTGTVSFNGTVAQTITGSQPNAFNNFILTNSAGLTMNSAGSIESTLTLTSGNLAAGANLSMLTGSEILRNAGSVTGILQGTGAYDVSYFGNSKTSGPELGNTGLRDLNINLTAGQTLTLSGTPALPDGNLTLLSGTLNAGASSIDRSSAGGNLTLGPNTTFITSGNDIAAFPINYTTRTIDASSTVEYLGTNQTVAINTYGNLILGGASGVKTFAGATTIAGNLSIAATTSANLGSANSTTNTLNLGGAGQPNGSYGSTASSAFFNNATYFGISATGILNVTTSTLICTNGLWIGGISTDWFTAANWCNGILPTNSTDVLIPSTAPNQPSINANGAVAKNLTIQSGASLVITGTFTLSVHGDWSNSGTFNSGTSSTVDFTGTPNAIIGAGSFTNVSFTGIGTKTLNATITVSENIIPIATSVVLSGTNTLTLNTGKAMEILSSGSLTTGSGKLILEPGANYVNRSTSNPALEVKQTLTGNKGWRMIGTPVTTTYDILTSGLETQGFPGSTNPTLQPNLLWWDETDKGTTLQGWRQPTNLSSNAPAGRGHYFYVFNGDTKPGGGNYTDALPKTMSLSGTEVNLASGSFNFGVTFTARTTQFEEVNSNTLIEVNQADEGFNMLANPTASVIDFHSASGWTKTNIDQSIYLWDPVSNAFLTWNGTSGDLGSGRIAPYQAFWVKANAATPNLILSGNDAKTLTFTSFFGRKQDFTPPTLELNVAGEGMEARSFITFGEDGKIGADTKDAYQLESLGEDWLLLYSFGSTKTRSPLVINHQPDPNSEDRVIPLHLAASKKGEPFNGTYLMDWKIPTEWPATSDIVLMDHINQKAIDMRKESMHTFSFEAPKASVSNARKTWNGLQVPQAVVFETPYEIGEEEEITPNIVNARTSSGSKPKRPFTIFIGAFPDDRIEYLPEFPKLFAPIPNPFKYETKIRFYLPVSEKATVSIYNLLGQEVGSFPAEEYKAGIQELDWIPSSIDLPSGMYVIRLSTTNGQFTQKLLKH
ncbi:T9SS type A sorting domain-containing protein [Algoriphagus sp.]|uniref:T9SS type A sorting domain-containing protein n=1 Tax=Algoriphagus sp. TaxID=1872435 RepID=UPI00391BD47B